MATEKPLVLLTGASGYLGFLTLIDLLKSGYRVRVAVRSDTKAHKIRQAPSFMEIAPSPEEVSFVPVPDMTAPGAYDEAVKGVQYIVHIASPIPSFSADNAPSPDDYENIFVRTAVEGDLGMLRSAAAAGSVKRIVLTSSVVAIVPFSYYIGTPGTDYGVQFNADSRISNAAGPYSVEFEAYSAGKAAALNAVEKWIADNGEQAGFDLVTIFPGWIFGRDEMIESAAAISAGGSTNSVLLGLLRGGKNEVGYNGNAVLGSDVARVHVLALDSKVKGNQSFIASTSIVWEDALKVLEAEFPEDVRAGRLSLEGKQPTQPIELDVSKTEKLLGRPFASFEEQVKEVASQYLELLSQA